MALDILEKSMAFGTYRLRDQICEDAVYHAIKTGYRVIDTAVLYKNHKQVGAAIRRAISDGICTRKELFVQSKIFNGDQKAGRDAIKSSINLAIVDLQLDYIDLILLHSWIPEAWEKAWCTLQELKTSGLCIHIGVSNYYVKQLDIMKSAASLRGYTLPSVNQIEISPFHYPKQTIMLCDKLGIVVQAHTPLIKGERMSHPLLVSLAHNEGINVAQLLLAWSTSKTWCLAVRSGNLQHIEENWNHHPNSLSPITINEMDNIKEMFVTHTNLLDHSCIEHGNLELKI
jgi:diketogulonate reductase-like aldo/keto reductase